MSNTPHKQPHEIIIPVIDETKPCELYQGSTLKLKIDALEEEVNALYLDPSNPVDYKHFGSFGLLIAKVGTAVERTGKDVAKDLRKDLKVYDDLRISSVKRIAALKAKFMLPRVQFDEEVADHARRVNDSFQLMQYGHKKIGEFSKATGQEWETLIANIEDIEMAEELFTDRLEEAKALKAESLEMNRARFAKFTEDEAALEAGREALRVKQDAEAAQRHAERAAEAASAKETPPATKTPETPKPAVTPTRTAKNAVHAQLMNYGMDKSQAVKFVNAVEAGKIKHLQIVT